MYDYKVDDHNFRLHANNIMNIYISFVSFLFLNPYSLIERLKSMDRNIFMSVAAE